MNDKEIETLLMSIVKSIKFEDPQFAFQLLRGAIKKAREEVCKQVENLLEGMHGTMVENNFDQRTLVVISKELEKLKETKK